MQRVRIALTLGHEASKSERNDYIRALLDAGFGREEIVVLPPGSEPAGKFDGVVLGGGLDVHPARYGREGVPARGGRLVQAQGNTALAPDGLVEAVESDGPWLVAVQWHPENLLEDPVSRRLFADFARAAREHAGEGISWPPDLLTPA